MKVSRVVGSNLLIFCGLLIVLTVGLECVALLMKEPSPRSSGRLFGVELAPLNVIAGKARGTERKGEENRNTPFVFDGKVLTVGDLEGAYREDTRLGYAPLEDSRSKNSWWQTNNIGARTRKNTNPSKQAGRIRYLIFGESYGLGSRIHQNSVWTSLLEISRSDVEWVNLCVDGYGMGQAYLRYLDVSQKIEFDHVIFVWVPSVDLWREVNVIRYLAMRWPSFTPMPRFIRSGDAIELVRSPYVRGSEIYERDVPQLTHSLQEHLRTYDRFYFPYLYEQAAWPIANLVVARWIRSIRGERDRIKVLNDSIHPTSEAMQITQRLFERLEKDAVRMGKTFQLLVLPTESELEKVIQGRADEGWTENWNRRIEELKRSRISAVDLLPHLSKASNVDRGIDGHHYGPELNRFLAETVGSLLSGG